MPGPVLDLEESLLLLELEAPFDKRQVQLARRRMAKRWHPDIAPPGRQHEHERHLKAINEAADQLETLAEESRGGKVSRNAVRASAMAARKAREEAGRRNYEAEQRARAAAQEQQKHDPFGARVPDHSVVHRYTRCLSYPEWGVGEVQGIYFTGDGEDVQQWARVKFQIGIRTVPAGSLQFVDFSTPDPGHERVERFMTAAQHAMAEENYALAARRLVYARDSAPKDPAVLRLLALAYWQGGDHLAAARAVRDWIRVEKNRPAPYRFASRIYEDQGAFSLAEESAAKVTRLTPRDGSGWDRLGRIRLRRGKAAGAKKAFERGQRVEPSVEGLLDLALANQLLGDVGGEVSACEAATRLDPESQVAWSRYAHALAKTDRTRDCLAACDRALALGDDPEVRDLAERVRAAEPRRLPHSTEQAA